MALFEQIIGKIKRLGFHPRFLHAANSMGLMRFRKSHLNLVRPGILLYGIAPSEEDCVPKGIRPVLSLKTRVSFLKNVDKGRSISYGGTYETASSTRIATLPVGYSHGYRVAFSNKAFVIIGGKKCPVVGRVTMDHTLVDVGKVLSVRRWDEVTLIGKDGKVGVSAKDLAALIDTIPYEIVCSIHSRIPRIYKNQ
jgi:alanine racemase